ncbi:hypothetical protein K504DRAFT_109019 [Pleomassaria siparia CBS 279.74]|uniref:Uncharacterized protein n=1 Tax=Pleomassaria siparia CBS 279.74 TaxID=1314801 RepID=A0A6G1JWM4_9PLEO|nr:hypothetical protein K504DRAFT_109019 [Pleomassaria siparia CBS 279.74]
MVVMGSVAFFWELQVVQTHPQCSQQKRQARGDFVPMWHSDNPANTLPSLPRRRDSAIQSISDEIQVACACVRKPHS